MFKSHTLSLLGLLLVCSSKVSASLAGPLSDDFDKWLNENGYEGYDFRRTDYGNYGSFGGYTGSATTVHNTPVIFVHGNSDTALHYEKSNSGWDNTIEYFLEQGYTAAELYATSWGDNKDAHASTRTHNCADVQRLRRFVEAVLAYTKKAKVSIVSHSMGVTLMRKAVHGGSISAKDGKCDIGSSLADKIEVFVGLSGANYGLCTCEGDGVVEATCNTKDGLWPGDSCGMNYLTCGLKPLPWPCKEVKYSDFLMEMNENPAKVADYIFSLWSSADTLIGYNNQVWGRSTSLIPLSTSKEIVATYSHMETKTKTAAQQFNMVHNKAISVTIS